MIVWSQQFFISFTTNDKKWTVSRLSAVCECFGLPTLELAFTLPARLSVSSFPTGVPNQLAQLSWGHSGTSDHRNFQDSLLQAIAASARLAVYHNNIVNASRNLRRWRNHWRRLIVLLRCGDLTALKDAVLRYIEALFKETSKVCCVDILSTPWDQRNHIFWKLLKIVCTILVTT